MLSSSGQATAANSIALTPGTLSVDRATAASPGRKHPRMQPLEVPLPYRGVFHRKALVSSGFLCSDMLAGTTPAPFRNNQARLVPCTNSPSTTTA